MASNDFLSNFYGENRKKKKKYNSYFLNNFSSGSNKKLNFNDINDSIAEELSGEPTGIERLQNQTLNYKTRLEAINADGKDTRNPLEKLLNLPEDQNVLFDIGELLDRPFNAIKGGIEAAQEGEDVVEGLKSGITGEEQYYAGDILRNAGVSDKELFKNPLSGEKVSMADLLGTGLDIFGDPTSYIPVGGLVKSASVANKGWKLAKAADTVTDATKALSTAQDAKKAIDALSTASDAERAASALRVANAADALSAANKTKNAAQQAYDLVKNMPAPNMSLQDAAVYGLAGGVSDLANITDRLVTRGLAKADDLNISRMVRGGATAKQLGRYRQTSDLYRGAKNAVSRFTNYNQVLPNNISNTVRASDDAVEAAATRATSRLDGINKQIDEYVKKGNDTNKDFMFKSTDDVNTALQEIFSRQNKTKTTNIYNFFSDAAYSNGRKQTAKLTGNLDELQKVADDLNNATVNGKRLGTQINLTVEPVKGSTNNQGQLILSGIKNKGKTNLRNVVKNKDFKQYLKGIDVNTPVQLQNKESQEALSALNSKVDDYVKQFNDDPELQRFYNEKLKIGQDFVNETGENLDFNQIWSKQGYFPKGLNENLRYNRNKAYAPAEYGNYSAGEANIIREDKRLSNIRSKDSTIASKTGMLSENRQQRIGEKIYGTEQNLKEARDVAKAVDNLKYNRISENEINALTSSLSDRNKRTLERALKAKNSQVKTKNLIKSKNEALANISDSIGDDVLKKVVQSNNTRLAKSYMSNTTKYNNELKKASNLEKQITKASNAGQDVSKMTKQLETAYDNAAKYKRSLDFQRSQIDGSLTNKITNSMQRTVDKTSTVSKRIESLTNTQKSAANKFDEVRKSSNDMVVNLENRLNSLKIQYENADPKLLENIESDKKLRESIKNLEQEKEMLQSDLGKDLFSTSIDDGLADFMNRDVRTNKDMVGYSTVLFDAGLHDDSIVRFINKDGTTKNIAGGVRVGKQELNDILTFAKKNKNLLPEGINTNIDDFAKQLAKSDGVYMDKTAYELINRNMFDDETTNVFVEGLNKVNDIFKTISTTSPGFHLRNAVGNYTNMALSGIPLTSAADELANANRVLNKNYMYRLLNKGASNASEAADLKLINQFLDSGFLDQADEIRDLQSVIKRFDGTDKYKGAFMDAFGKIFDFNRKVNFVVDSRTRMAVMNYANKHPEYLSKLGLSNPTQAARFVAMDPSNMTPFEKSKMRKILPFYTFTKQNMLFQAKNFLRNSSKYTELIRALNLSYGELDEDQYREYQKSGMQIPVYTDEEGNTLMLKTNLPAADLGEWFDSPTNFVQRFVSSSTPLLKTPVEIATGVDPFTGYESNKSGLDYLAGILGLSNVTRAFENVPQVSEDNTSAENFARILSSVGAYNEAETIANSNAYNEFLEYQEYIDELKSQGIEVPTIAELEEQGVDVEAVRDQIAGNDSLLRRLKRNRERFQKSLGF